MIVFENACKLVGLILSGLTIAVLFMAFLVVATSQQKVATSLKKSDSGLSYAQALDLMEQTENIKNDLSKLSKEIANPKSQKSRYTKQITDESKAADRYREKLQAVVTEAKLSDWCPNSFPKKGDGLTDKIIMERIGICLAAGKNADSLFQYSEIMINYSGLRTATNRVVAARENLAAIESAYEKRVAIENEYLKLKTKAASVRPLFLPERKLKELLKIGWLFQIPPVVMPIFLTFFSGLFGAMLIHFILVCYPDNRYSTIRSAAISQYVILGGLIATAIFVALGAGTSVLGFSGDGIGEPDNYLAVSAIGLFSGMFSNRAADWLSNRASFLSSDNASTDNANVIEGQNPVNPI